MQLLNAVGISRRPAREDVKIATVTEGHIVWRPRERVADCTAEASALHSGFHARPSPALPTGFEILERASPLPPLLSKPGLG